MNWSCNQWYQKKVLDMNRTLWNLKKRRKGSNLSRHRSKTEYQGLRLRRVSTIWLQMRTVRVRVTVLRTHLASTNPLSSFWREDAGRVILISGSGRLGNTINLSEASCSLLKTSKLESLSHIKYMEVIWTRCRNRQAYIKCMKWQSIPITQLTSQISMRRQKALLRSSGIRWIKQTNDSSSPPYGPTLHSNWVRRKGYPGRKDESWRLSNWENWMGWAKKPSKGGSCYSRPSVTTTIHSDPKLNILQNKRKRTETWAFYSSRTRQQS